MDSLVEISVYECLGGKIKRIYKFASPVVPRQGEHFDVMGEKRLILGVIWEIVNGKLSADLYIED